MSELLEMQTGCPYCGQETSGMAELQNHIAVAHLTPPNLQAMYAAQLVGNGSGSSSDESAALGPSMLALLGLGQPKTSEGGGDMEAYLRALSSAGSGGLDALAAAFMPGSGGALSTNSTPLPLSPGQGPNNNGNVVNPEAYCELCRKEFCNKYFLRTHKAKKHGILEESPGSLKRGRGSISSGSGGSPAAGGLARNSDYNTAAAHASVIHSLFRDAGAPPAPKRLQLEQNVERTGNANAATPPATSERGGGLTETAGSFPCAMCGKSFPAYFNLLTHHYQEHGDLSAVGLPPELAVSLSTAFVPVTSLANSITPTKHNDMELFCELCQKEFSSKHFLRQHKQNAHGIRETPEGTPTPPAAASPLKARGTPSSSLGGAPFFPSAARLNVGGLFKDPASPSLFQSPTSHLPPTMVSQAQGFAGITSPIHNGPSMPKTRSYSSGKNFCDICNKEVCNKYFLRTHMLKMHGIVIDEHKTVIGNINTLDKEKTGTLIFRCDICAKELRTREALRSHKQESHGVMPRSIPSIQAQPQFQSQPTTPVTAKPMNFHLSNTNSQLDVKSGIVGSMGNPVAVLLCPFCECKASNTKELQAHILKECPQRPLLRKDFTSVPSGNQSDGSSPTLSQNSEHSSAGNESQASNGLKCELCSERFRDATARQFHVFTAHASELGAAASNGGALDALSLLGSFRFPDKASTDSGSSDAPAPSDNAESDGSVSSAAKISLHDATKTYRCDVCPYNTNWAATLAAHKRGHFDTANEGKTLTCVECGRGYSSRTALIRHMECHRSSRVAGPDLVAKYRSPTKPTADGAKRYRCTVGQCGKMFKTRELCRLHMSNLHQPAPPKEVEDVEMGWAEPAGAVNQPRVVQMFRTEVEGLGPLNLYLPVPAPLSGPLSLLLTLNPVPDALSRIKAL